jgi:hypothetical protein
MAPGFRVTLPFITPPLVLGLMLSLLVLFAFAVCNLFFAHVTAPRCAGVALAASFC